MRVFLDFPDLEDNQALHIGTYVIRIIKIEKIKGLRVTHEGEVLQFTGENSVQIMGLDSTDKNSRNEDAY